MEVFSGHRPPPSSPLVCKVPGRTRQSEKDSCDINKLMAKYERVGSIPGPDRELLFADVSNVGDFREALERVEHAQEMFMKQPAKLRARFANDPAEFLDFCSDENNRSEMKELGLLKEEVVVQPPEEPVVPAEPVPAAPPEEPSA